MSNEQNATSNQPSLLDRIHLFREFAKRGGWSDVAEWLTKHADEPCPAAIAEFMEMDGTPPSEPSRTDAVKGAIALVGGRWIAHEGCDRASGVCRQSDKRVCDVVQAASILLTALADAERESVHYKDELAAATKRERALEEQVADVERRLATARKAITVGLRIIGYPADGMPPLEGDDELHALHKFKTTMQAAVAAIDAPAGEEAGANGRGVSVTPLPPSDQMCDFTYWATAPPGITKPMSRCINRKPCALHSDAPPPEPANAQGSEGECGVPLYSSITDRMIGQCENTKPCALHPEPSHPSAPRFTAEEAREQARTEAMLATRCESARRDDGNEFLLKDAEDHGRKAAMMRHYADLLDRDDALERTAERMSVAAHRLLRYQDLVFNLGRPAADYVTKAINVEADALRSVLAQRAGKVE